MEEKTQEARIETAEIKFLKSVAGYTRKNPIINIKLGKE
jgi:hypothetical protein